MQDVNKSIKWIHHLKQMLLLLVFHSKLFTKNSRISQWKPVLMYTLKLTQFNILWTEVRLFLRAGKKGQTFWNKVLIDTFLEKSRYLKVLVFNTLISCLLVSPAKHFWGFISKINIWSMTCHNWLQSDDIWSIMEVLGQLWVFSKSWTYS